MRLTWRPTAPPVQWAYFDFKLHLRCKVLSYLSHGLMTQVLEIGGIPSDHGERIKY